MNYLNPQSWINFLNRLRVLGLSPHCHEGQEYYVRDGLEVRKVEGKVGMYGVAAGGPFHRVEKQVVCAISPFANRADVVTALRSLTAYFERLPDSEFGGEPEPAGRVVHGVRK